MQSLRQSYLHFVDFNQKITNQEKQDINEKMIGAEDILIECKKMVRLFWYGIVV